MSQKDIYELYIQGMVAINNTAMMRHNIGKLSERDLDVILHQNFHNLQAIMKSLSEATKKEE